MVRILYEWSLWRNDSFVTRNQPPLQRMQRFGSEFFGWLEKLPDMTGYVMWDTFMRKDLMISKPERTLWMLFPFAQHIPMDSQKGEHLHHLHGLAPTLDASSESSTSAPLSAPS